jgi:hypothetical protein
VVTKIDWLLTLMVVEIENLGPLDLFISTLKTAETEKQYLKRLNYFFNYLEFSTTTTVTEAKEIDLKEQALIFVRKAETEPQWARNCIISYKNHLKQKFVNKQLSSDSVTGYFNPIQSFCEINDLHLNWKVLRGGLPDPKIRANDRIQTVEELRKLCEYEDRRVKVIVYVMCSSGIRVGAWDYLKWKHVKPITNAEYLRWKKKQQLLESQQQQHHHQQKEEEATITKEDEDKIIAAKLEVYAGEPEEYFSFITPEAFFAIKDYMDFREKYGEKITGESWVLRDKWKTTNVKYAAKKSLATRPKKLSIIAIKKLLNRAIWQQHLRQPLGEGVRRHEYKTTHSFRKYFKTTAQYAIKNSECVEFLMGHKSNLSGAYNRASMYQLLDDYLKGVDLLAINPNTIVVDITTKAATQIQKQVTELTEKEAEKTKRELERVTELQKQQAEKLEQMSQNFTKAFEFVTTLGYNHAHEFMNKLYKGYPRQREYEERQQQRKKEE